MFPITIRRRDTASREPERFGLDLAVAALNALGSALMARLPRRLAVRLAGQRSA
jgi:hypothetical protein